MHLNWDKSVSSTDVVSIVKDTNASDGIVLSELVSKSYSEIVPFTPRRHMKVTSRGSRRQPSRESKNEINYKSMLAIFGKKASISKKIISSIVV